MDRLWGPTSLGPDDQEKRKRFCLCKARPVTPAPRTVQDPTLARRHRRPAPGTLARVGPGSRVCCLERGACVCGERKK